MNTATRLPDPPEMYRALVDRDETYDGLFVAAIRTTGIFCRPSCAARKPRVENVEFFSHIRDALFAGYRPCKRCRPMDANGGAPAWLGPLLDELHRDPERRWRDRDLRERGLDPSSVRRWFHREYGMTFHAYHRAMRLGAALGRINGGASISTTAFDSGYESLSGFRDAFGRAFGAPPGQVRDTLQLVMSRVKTSIGPMVAAASDEALYLLEFADRRMLETQMTHLVKRTGGTVVPGTNSIIEQTQSELDGYFAGELRDFTVPLETPGTGFQRLCWDYLRAIPYGETRSYGDEAAAIGRPRAVRAVGRANGDNRVAIIIPCHRVLQSSGRLAGYGGGIWRKRWLIEHEGAHLQTQRREIEDGRRAVHSHLKT
jgi:AraC family transcriptional regulator, regulatory protein of adaptative response / methylated-DNA-[protein]-cysteine methyltransferase